MAVTLHTMYDAERHVSLPSRTADGGEINVPYLHWYPGSTPTVCESDDQRADGRLVPCGKPVTDEVHLKLARGSHHDFVMSEPQPGMSLVLDQRLGYTVPTTITSGEAAELIEFVANAIAIGAGYPSIYFTKRKMPFRG